LRHGEDPQQPAVHNSIQRTVRSRSVLLQHAPPTGRGPHSDFWSIFQKPQWCEALTHWSSLKKATVKETVALLAFSFRLLISPSEKRAPCAARLDNATDALHRNHLNT
jgi:hypothetical protein